VLVIGGGLAGWRAAEAAAKAGASVALVANGAGNSPDIHALNVPVRPDDSPERFLEDTLRSGRGGCDPALAETLCREAPALAAEFPFDREADGSYALLQPVGCSVPRCVTIGHRIGAWALDRLRAELEGKVAVAGGRVEKLIRLPDGAFEAEASSTLDSSRFKVRASAVVLATGGWCAKYDFSDNPSELQGDGIGLAQSLGAAVRDMDCIQYEPTVALAPEAVRRVPVITTMLHEGATFRNRDGAEFLADKHANKDELSRAIFAEIAAGRGVPVPGDGGLESASPLASASERGDGGLESASLLASASERGGGGLESASPLASASERGGGGLESASPLASASERGGGLQTAVNDEGAFGVWFDATGVPAEILRTRYADTVRRYAAAGVDITREPMLVAPAPHTSLGGVVIDGRCRVLDASGAPVPGLYAAGEVTGGVHGFNRIGGNAGTEVLVFGRIAGEEAARFC